MRSPRKKEDEEELRKLRRGILIGVLALVACQPAAAPLGSAENPVKMVFVPSGETEEILAGAGDLEPLLEERTGLQFESFVSNSYVAAAMDYLSAVVRERMV